MLVYQRVYRFSEQDLSWNAAIPPNKWLMANIPWWQIESGKLHDILQKKKTFITKVGMSWTYHILSISGCWCCCWWWWCWWWWWWIWIYIYIHSSQQWESINHPAFWDKPDASMPALFSSWPSCSSKTFCTSISNISMDRTNLHVRHVRTFFQAEESHIFMQLKAGTSIKLKWGTFHCHVWVPEGKWEQINLQAWTSSKVGIQLDEFYWRDKTITV